MPPGLTGCCRGIAVKQLWLGWAKRAVQAARMAGQRGRRRRAPRSAWMAEMLESRQLLTLTLPQPLVNDVPVGKSGLIALPVTNDTSNPVSFQVTSDNPQVTATVLQGGRSLLMNVSGKDGSNVDFTGDLVFRLFETEAPQTVARIESFANSNFYDNLTFHRILPGFVAQGGDPNGNGTGGSGTKLPDEYATNLTFTSQGLLAMANSGDDTGDSQFFITALDQTLSQLPQHLNFQHTVFGILTGGFDTFRKLIATPTIGNGSGTPVSKPVINNVTLFTDNQPGVVRVTPAAGFTGTVNLTVNANDGNGAVAQRVVPVTVVADTVNDRAFLGAVSNQTAIQGRPVSFTVQGFDLENDNLTFQIRDAASWSANDSTGTAPANVATNISVTPASNGNPAVATITLTPSVTFSGTVNLRLGVRDQVARDGLTLDQRGNFDTQAFTLTVSPVNHAPNAPGGTVSTPANTAVNITLPGDDGDPDKTQVLTYSIVSQPNSGTISALNPTTGALIYTPATGFNGVVTFTYRISDDGGHGEFRGRHQHDRDLHGAGRFAEPGDPRAPQRLGQRDVQQRPGDLGGHAPHHHDGPEWLDGQLPGERRGEHPGDRDFARKLRRQPAGGNPAGGSGLHHRHLDAGRLDLVPDDSDDGHLRPRLQPGLHGAGEHRRQPAVDLPVGVPERGVQQ